jgi:hypothetical protein
VKVTFGRADKSRVMRGLLPEYPVGVDGVQIGVITCSSYDRHARRSAERSYDACFYYGGRYIRASGSLRDVKRAVAHQLTKE